MSTCRPTPAQIPAGAARRFTLVELLVIIAIVAILASMLLPGLQSAKYTATGPHEHGPAWPGFPGSGDITGIAY